MIMPFEFSATPYDYADIGKFKKSKSAFYYIFNCLLGFSKKLGKFDRRITNFQKLDGIFDDAQSQIIVNNDFYSYLKDNQKNLTDDLSRLNTEFLQCKKELSELCSLYEGSLHDSPITINEIDGVIQFPKPVSAENVRILKIISEMIDAGDDLVEKIEAQQEQILTKSNDVISQMRSKF